MKFAAGVFAVALAAATAAAQAPTTHSYMLPPLEYDYPYRGKLTIVRDKEDLPDVHLCPYDKDRAFARMRHPLPQREEVRNLHRPRVYASEIWPRNCAFSASSR
jgi:hypothetical protein